MTDVAFHFNAPDRLAYACRLIRKAVGSGAKLLVTGSSKTLEQLDAALWTMSPVDFVPHCYLAADALVTAASPVVLSLSTQSSSHQHVLLNLGQLAPEGFDRFERVIEIVGADDEGLQSARRRWKYYADLGYTITRHDLALKNTH